MAFKGQASPFHPQILRSQYGLVCFTSIGCNSLRNSLQPFQSRTMPLTQCPGWTMVRSGRGRTLAPNDINTLIHLLSPIKHAKFFQECFAHASIKNKLTKKSSQLICSSLHSACPGLRIYNQILCLQLFVLVLFLPFRMSITFIWNKIGLIGFNLLSVLGFLFVFTFTSFSFLLI